MKELDKLQHKLEQTTDKKEKIKLLNQIKELKEGNEIIKNADAFTEDLSNWDVK